MYIINLVLVFMTNKQPIALSAYLLYHRWTSGARTTEQAFAGSSSANSVIGSFPSSVDIINGHFARG